MPVSHPATTRQRVAATCGGNEALFPRVLEAAEAVADGHRNKATILLEELLEDAPARGSALQRVTHCFAQALRARLAGDQSGAGNLYLDGHGPGDMLAAYQVLMRATPIVRFGYATANQALDQALDDAPAVHLIDIGIGSGAQWLTFFPLLAARRRIPAVRLTGIDLPYPGSDPDARLRAAGEVLGRQARQLGIPFAFQAVAAPVEDVDFAPLAARPGEVLAVNAAFALHHIPADDASADADRNRDAVLRRLAALRPRRLTLVEPNAEHNALSFLPRVSESLVHYLTVFDALGTQLPEDSPERAVLERAFFGREILNIVSGEGPQRVERHEHRWSWNRRLRGQGFGEVDCASLADGVRHALDLSSPWAVTADSGALLLSWRHIPLLAASAWRTATTP
jgi:hypothetical protein